MKKLFLIFLFVISFNFICALEANLTLEEESQLCLNESKEIYLELIEGNFSVLRVNDSLNTAYNLYEAQNVLKQKGKRTDYSLILPYCEEIKKIKEDAYFASDEIFALKKFYNESFYGEKINTSTVDELIYEIELEMKNERYEKISSLVDKTYKQIIEVKARDTSVNAFYQNTRKSLGEFIKEKGIYLAISIVLLVILFFIYKKTIYKRIINKKIEKLELRKKTLKEIIQKTQKDYFQNGKISENEFNIKTKKLAELIRDIDRQIPLLFEDIAKLNKKKHFKRK